MHNLFWPEAESAQREACKNSIEYGGTWTVWKDWSFNERVKVTTYEEFIANGTAADYVISFYENGEEF